VEGLGVSAWQGRSVFVTGAYGLLGSWLVKTLLEAGARADQRDQDGHTALRLAETLKATPAPPPFPGAQPEPREFDQIIALLRAAAAK